MPLRHPALAQFGKNVRHRREAVGLSQEELAEKVDLNRTYVSGVERCGRLVESKNVSRRLQLIGRTLPDIHLQTVELRNNDNSHHVTYRPQTTGRFSLPIKELIPR